ncbi:sugar phosphate isomerase [Bacteroidia bacterium]|nr:sugar phosphate isomerase [Bacteroidia bacterium]
MKKIFITVLSALAITACCHSAQPQPEQMKEIALQLYSLRDAFKTDFDATIDAVGKMGYASVEAANYNDGKFYGKTPAEFKAAVEKAGLKVLSSHTTKTLTDEELAAKNFAPALEWWNQAIDAHLAAGMQYIVAPWMNVPKTLADLQTYCEYYDAVGKLCAERGLLFGYHNHSHEFALIEGQRMYDYMIEHTNPEYVFFQMDVYWVMMAQQSPVEYFNRYPGRFKVLHIKDQKELGQSGMVGFDAILRSLEIAGTKHLVVEVEKYNYTPQESVKKSLEYLNNLIITK